MKKRTIKRTEEYVAFYGQYKYYNEDIIDGTSACKWLIRIAKISKLKNKSVTLFDFTDDIDKDTTITINKNITKILLSEFMVRNISMMIFSCNYNNGFVRIAVLTSKEKFGNIIITVENPDDIEGVELLIL